MGDAALGYPQNQTFASPHDSDYSNPGLEAGLSGERQGAVNGGFLRHASCLAHWLGGKFKELLVIALIGIPLAQLFLESQQKQKPKVASPDWLDKLVFIGWIAWVCVAIVLALDNFKYLAKNKFDIIKAAITFCAAPTVDRFTAAKFADRNAIYPICLVLAVVCPEIYRLWSPGADTRNERQE